MRWRGYDRESVDALLARCAETLGSGTEPFPELDGLTCPHGERVTRGDVETATFAVVVRGYDLAAVDALLRRLALVLPPDPVWSAPPLPPPAAPPARLRRTLRGYDVGEVDAFLPRLAHTLAERVQEFPQLLGYLRAPRCGPPLRPAQIRAVQFRIRPRGYDIAEVDDLLDSAAARLAGSAAQPPKN